MYALCASVNMKVFVWKSLCVILNFPFIHSFSSKEQTDIKNWHYHPKNVSTH